MSAISALGKTQKNREGVKAILSYTEFKASQVMLELVSKKQINTNKRTKNKITHKEKKNDGRF